MASFDEFGVDRNMDAAYVSMRKFEMWDMYHWLELVFGDEPIFSIGFLFWHKKVRVRDLRDFWQKIFGPDPSL